MTEILDVSPLVARAAMGDGVDGNPDHPCTSILTWGSTRSRGIRTDAVAIWDVTEPRIAAACRGARAVEHHQLVGDHLRLVLGNRLGGDPDSVFAIAGQGPVPHAGRPSRRRGWPRCL